MTEQYKNSQIRNGCEDSFNLVDFFIVLVKHKWLILLTMIIPGFIIYSVLPPPSPPTITYYSDCIFSISDIAQIEKVEGIIKNQILISKSDILPVLYPELWDAKESAWKTAKPPTMTSARELLQERTTVKIDKVNGIVELGFSHNSHALPQKMLQNIIGELKIYFSEDMKKKISDSARVIQMLRKELASTHDRDLRKSIAENMAYYISNEKRLLVNAERSPINIMSPPTDVYIKKGIKGAKSGLNAPARILLSFPPMLIIGIFFAFCMEFIENLKKKESERLEKIREYLKIRHKKHDL
jgi:hypothetical protein